MKKPIIITTSTILILAIVLGVYLLNGCQKNVEPIELITSISVSSSVYNSETFVGISDAEIAVDGTIITTTDTNGKFTISDLKPGNYQITSKKSGFSKSTYELTVEDKGAKLPNFVLKELSEPVIIGSSGGIAEAVKSSGNQAAKLVIPAGELSGDKEVSITNLVGNEVPKILESTDQLLGTTITLNSNDENIEFGNGAQLTFQLPFMHKPGDNVEVTHFNEETNEWETFDNAIVSDDGMSATVIIHHFSTYSANVKGSYNEEPEENIGLNIVGNSETYDSIYEWNSRLEYTDEIPEGIDKEWLYTTVENQTKLNFSEVKYLSSQKSITDITNSAYVSSNVSPPPVGNPSGYQDQPERSWELIEVCCYIKEWVNAELWMEENNGYEVESIGNRYLVCSLFWVWFVDDEYQEDTRICFPDGSDYCNPYTTASGPVVIEECKHEGGSAN